MNDNSTSVEPAPTDAEQALAFRVTSAQERMRRSVMIGRLQNDPLADVVDAMADAIGVQHELHVANMRTSSGGMSTEHVEKAAAEGASAQAATLARAHNRRTLLLTGAVFVVGAVAAAFGGYLAGRSSAVATVSAVQAAAVRDGPAAAAMWAQLMASNDGTLVAQTCKETSAKSDGGRRACVLGLWTEPPVNSGPRTAPISK